ncbi:MAG: DUF2089 family protein [Tepidisphaeraceae bacterium]
MALNAQTRCPSCGGTMRPAVLACDACAVEVKGPFTGGNEFAALDAEQLHLLRVFVHCEGSIRDMEAALGVSYPTVKARLAALRQTLEKQTQAPTPASTTPRDIESDVAAVLSEMKTGHITPADAARMIRDLRRHIALSLLAHGAIPRQKELS